MSAAGVSAAETAATTATALRHQHLEDEAGGSERGEWRGAEGEGGGEGGRTREGRGERRGEG